VKPPEAEGYFARWKKFSQNWYQYFALVKRNLEKIYICTRTLVRTCWIGRNGPGPLLIM